MEIIKVLKIQFNGMDKGIYYLPLDHPVHIATESLGENNHGIHLNAASEAYNSRESFETDLANIKQLIEKYHEVVNNA